MDIRFCDRCHESIPDGDFDAGRAVTLGGKHLHVVCALQRTTSLAGPRSWLTFFLALLAAVGVTYVLARDGWQGAGKGVSSAVEKRIAEGDRAAAQATARTDEALRGVQTSLADALGQASALRDEIRLLKDGVAGRLESLERASGGALTTVQERIARVEQELADVSEWIRNVAQRAEEGAAPPAAPEPTGPRPAPAPPEGPAATPGEPKPEPPVAPPPPDTPAPPPGPDPARAGEVDRWIQRLKDPNEGIAFSATIELGRLKDLRAVAPLVDVLASHKDFYARLGAATALGELRAVDAVPALVEALNDKDDLVRTAADEALQLIAEPVLTAKDREDLRFQANMGTQDRRGVVSRWKKWWKANEQPLRLARAQPAR